MTKIIAIYTSREDKCPHKFSTSPVDSSVVLPPTTIRFCSTCEKTHFFFKEKFYFTSTPSQLSTAKKMSENIGVVEFDVDINQ